MVRYWVSRPFSALLSIHALTLPTRVGLLLSVGPQTGVGDRGEPDMAPGRDLVLWDMGRLGGQL